MEQTIKDWAKKMVQLYTWLTVKFEYNNRFNTILVDFVYQSQYAENEDFHKEVLAFYDKMHEIYGEDAPLFTDNEKLFSLSDNAQIISSNSYSFDEFITIAFGLGLHTDWCQSKTPEMTSYSVIEDSSYINSFEKAA